MNMKFDKRNLPLHLMILPGIVFIILFGYIPMLGSVIAFQKFIPNRGWFGSKWVGLDNFIYMLNIPDISTVLFNTVFIATMKILLGLIVPIIVSLLLNEVRKKYYKKIVQTLIYLPHFLSWVILGGIFIDILAVNGGIINNLIVALGLKPVFFLGDNKWFPMTLILTDVWKEFGFSTIIYMAALTAIDPGLYEAAIIDGAGRWKQTLYVTLPGITSTIIVLAVLNLMNILNAGFEQIFVLYSPQVYQSGDILDTLLYRIGFIDAQYGVSAAVGLFKSTVSLVLIIFSYKLAYKLANYRIF